MEKLMSFFQPTEKRKPAKYEEESEDRSETPPPDERRKWSISRSGRMKQANKKRHNVTIDLYGEVSIAPKISLYRVCIKQSRIKTTSKSTKRINLSFHYILMS